MAGSIIVELVVVNDDDDEYLDRTFVKSMVYCFAGWEPRSNPNLVYDMATQQHGSHTRGNQS